MAAWAGSGLEKGWLAKLSLSAALPSSCSKGLPFARWRAHPLLRSSLKVPVFFVSSYSLAIFRHYLPRRLPPGYPTLAQCRLLRPSSPNPEPLGLWGRSVPGSPRYSSCAVKGSSSWRSPSTCLHLHPNPHTSFLCPNPSTTCSHLKQLFLPLWDSLGSASACQASDPGRSQAA